MITAANGFGNMRLTFESPGLTTGMRNSIQIYYRGLKLAERDGGVGHYDLEWSATPEDSWIVSVFIQETPDIRFHDINLGASNAYIEVIDIRASE